MFTAINPPAKPTPQQVEKSDWDRAWDSLPKRADGKWDWENTDRIDLETASSIDYAAGEEIRKVWQANMKSKHKID